MNNLPAKRIRVRIHATSSEVNSRIPDISQHFVGGLHYTVNIRSSKPDDQDRLLEIVRQLDPAREMAAQRLLEELGESEAALLNWIERSPSNAEWFVKDPINAISAANIVSKQTLAELKALSSALASKVEGAS